MSQSRSYQKCPGDRSLVPTQHQPPPSHFIVSMKSSERFPDWSCTEKPPGRRLSKCIRCVLVAPSRNARSTSPSGMGAALKTTVSPACSCVANVGDPGCTGR
eukprot:scaffold275130_cov36-Tisochrysis_lutea.AAC.3